MKIIKVVSIIGFIALAISISTLILVYNGKKEDRPYSAKLVHINIIDRGVGIG